MAAIELKRLVMAGPFRWVVLTAGEEVTTFLFFVKVRYTEKGSGNVLFVRSDLQADGEDDVFAVFTDNPVMAEHVRDRIFYYTPFAGAAPIVEAQFRSSDDFPASIVEEMTASDGTTVRLAFYDLGEPQAAVRAVDEKIMEVLAFAVPADFELEINGVAPVGEVEQGPLAGVPPVGADLQNLWYERT